MLKFNAKSNRTMVEPKFLEALDKAAEAVSFDVLVTCAFRNEIEQNRAFKQGKSKLKWPDSAHNKRPSLAVDVVPVVAGKLMWADTAKFKQFRTELAKHIELKHEIVWDLCHMEVKCG